MSTHVSTTLSLVTFLILERFLFFHGVTDLGNPAQQDDFIIIIMVLTHYSGDTYTPPCFSPLGSKAFIWGGATARLGKRVHSN